MSEHISTGNLAVILTISSLQASSGVTEVVCQLADAFVARGLSVHVVLWSAIPDEKRPTSPAVRLHYAEQTISFRHSFSFWRKLSIVVGEIHSKGQIPVMHDHGMWLPSNLLTGLFSITHKVPLVISPHGMLEDWALGYRAGKKKLAWLFYQKPLLIRASLLHATAKQESQSIMALVPGVSIRVIPLGVSRPVPVPALVGRGKKVLFLSRLHPKKGVEDVLLAWARICPTGWVLQLAGPDEGGYTGRMQALAISLGIGDQVEFLGPVYGKAKWALYDQAAFFVLPTRSENFGLVIAEALLSGLPVITTKGAPWQVIAEQRCGWWLDHGIDALEAALREAFACDETTRLQMAERGMHLMRTKYAWHVVAERLLECYATVVENR